MTIETELKQTNHQNNTNNPGDGGKGNNNNQFGTQNQLDASLLPVKVRQDTLADQGGPGNKFDQQLESDIKSTVERLIQSVEAVSGRPSINGSSQLAHSSAPQVAGASVAEPPSVTPLVQDDDLNDNTEPKDIITLRNLEISPPPPSESLQSSTSELMSMVNEQQREQLHDQAASSSKKRSRDTKDELNPTTEGRAKRQRTQTKLFQVGSVSGTTSRSARSSTSGSLSSSPPPRRSVTANRINPCAATKNQTNDLQDVIFYEKNDYLAIRNEEDSFYLCQLAENIRESRPNVKVKWLDTSDDGKTYFLTQHYDSIPLKSIIMPVIPNKLKGDKKRRQILTLDDQVKNNIMDRLKRSLNVLPSENKPSQELAETT